MVYHKQIISKAILGFKNVKMDLPVQIYEEHNQVKCHKYETVPHMNLYHTAIMYFCRIK